MIDAAGHGQAVISQDAEVIYPDWSPDGRYLTLMEPVEGGYQLAIADFGSGSVPATVQVRHGIGPVFGTAQNVWSPDGGTIVARIDGTEEVVVIDAVSGDWTSAPWPATLPVLAAAGSLTAVAESGPSSRRRASPGLIDWRPWFAAVAGRSGRVRD